MNSEQGRHLLHLLDEQQASLLLLRGNGIVHRSDRRGIGPLLDAISEHGVQELGGVRVVDRVIGKAAAFLVVVMRAEVAAAGVMSQAGADLLRAHQIGFHAREIVERIDGRNGGPCPFESSVSAVDDPAEALDVLRALLDRFRSGATS